MMLLITSVASYFNKDFETDAEFWITIILSFAVLFLVFLFKDSFPLNIFLVAGFSGIVGWSI